MDGALLALSPQPPGAPGLGDAGHRPRGKWGQGRASCPMVSAGPGKRCSHSPFGLPCPAPRPRPWHTGGRTERSHPPPLAAPAPGVRCLGGPPEKHPSPGAFTQLGPPQTRESARWTCLCPRPGLRPRCAALWPLTGPGLVSGWPVGAFVLSPAKGASSPQLLPGAGAGRGLCRASHPTGPGPRPSCTPGAGRAQRIGTSCGERPGGGRGSVSTELGAGVRPDLPDR